MRVYIGGILLRLWILLPCPNGFQYVVRRHLAVEPGAAARCPASSNRLLAGTQLPTIPTLGYSTECPVTIAR